MRSIKLVLALVIAGGWLGWEQGHAADSAEALQSVAVLNIGLEARPFIDGRLVEDFWQNCQTLDLNSVLPKTLNKQPAQRTMAKIATDGAWLFVGFTVEDKTLLDASLGQAGLSFMYDCVEFYLDPGTGGERFFRFGANRFGRSRADQKGAEISHMSYPCNIHWRAAGAETTDGWSVEMAIPLFRLAELDGAGPDWRVNFCRADTDPAEATSWAPVHTKFAEPELFGRLVFSPPDLMSANASQPFAPHLTYVQAGPTTDQTGEYVSAVRIGLAKGHADAGGMISLKLRDESIPEKPVVITTNLTLAPDKQQFGVIMTLKRPLEFIPQPEVTLSVQDDMGSWSQTMVHGQGVIEESYSAWLDRSYYTSERQAMLYVQSLGKAPVNATINVVSADERLRPAPARLLSPGVWSVAIPLSELPPGKYALDVQVEDSGVSAPPERQFVVLSKLPPASAGREVKIDRYNRRLLVGDQPFFPFGVVWQRAQSADLDLAFLKQLGFNTVIRWIKPERVDGKSDTLAEIMAKDSLLAAAKDHDIMVIEHPVYSRSRDAQNRRVWLWEYPLFVDNYYDWKTNELPVVMNVAAAHPSTLSYEAMDEPSNVLLQPGNVPLSTILNDLMETLNQMDPYKPVFLTFGGLLPDQMEWLDKQTWFATFNYWLVQPDSTEHARNMVKVLTHNAKVAEKHNKPLVLIPTTEINWSAQAVPMTAAENRAQLYMLLVHDAKGIIYFVWPWRHAATDTYLAELAQEVQTLAPALMRRRPAQRVVYDTNGGDGSLLLSALIVEPDNTPLLMILNADNAPVRFNCSLPWLNGDYRLTSCFDDAHAELKNGSFQADLGTLSSRVYRITGAAITNTWEMHDIAIRVEQDSDDAALANLIPDASFKNPSAWPLRERDVGRVNFIDAPGETDGRLVVLDGAKGGGLYLCSSPITVRPYHRYRMSATFRYTNAHSGAAAGMGLREANNLDGVTLPGMACGNPKQSGWQTAEREVQVNTDHPSSVQMLVYWNAPADAGLSFKEITLQDLGPVTVTESLTNRVPNPGFEHARLPGWPDYWTTHDMNNRALISRLGTPTAIWRLDERNPHSGRVSLRMEPSAGATVSTPYFRPARGIPAEEGRTFDFSAWVRAENEQIPVRVIVRGIAEETFKVGYEWTKIELSGVKTNTFDNSFRDFTSIRFDAPKGTIWIDDVCLTERAPAAEKAVDAPSDKKD